MNTSRRGLIKKILNIGIFTISLVLIFSIIFIIFKSFTNAYDGANIKVKADYVTISNLNLRFLFPSKIKDSLYWNSLISLLISLITLIISTRIIESKDRKNLIYNLKKLSKYYVVFSILKMFIYISRHNLIKLSPTSGLPFLFISLLLYSISTVIKEEK